MCEEEEKESLHPSITAGLRQGLGDDHDDSSCPLTCSLYHLRLDSGITVLIRV